MHPLLIWQRDDSQIVGTYAPSCDPIIPKPFYSMSVKAHAVLSVNIQVPAGRDTIMNILVFESLIAMQESRERQ